MFPRRLSPYEPRSVARFLAITVLLISGVVFIPSTRAAASVGLPGGRSNYVVSLFGGSTNAYWVRAAEYTFTAAAGLNGTVHERFWYWNQSTFTGNATSNKILTGYTTSGCQFTCPIKAPIGFQPGSVAKTLSGSYYIDVYGRLVITWPGGQLEAWTATGPTTTCCMATGPGRQRTSPPPLAATR
jgi:hypothetical protein